MTERLLGTVSGQTVGQVNMIKAWGRTTGGGTPVLGPVSFGVSSITDAAAGQLDITWTKPFGSASSYTIIANIRSSGTQRTAEVQRTATTASIFSVIDPVGGWQWIAIGI